MSGLQRVVFLAIAVVIAAGAFLVLGRDDDEPAVEAPSAAGPTPREREAEARPAPTATPTPRARPPLLTAGTDRVLRFEKGDTVRFRVRHPEAEEVHVHGYDIVRELQPGRTATVSFRAGIEGVFEIELERSHQPLGSLEVSP